jgi:putative membrane protein
MILPGVSGGYLLLVLGVYVPILAGIDRFKEGLRSGDLGLAIDPALTVLLPVGIGVVVGVVAVSHLLKWLLERLEKATLGFLVGLLVGAVVGLWPFQRTVPPVVGETVIKGQVVTAERLSEIAVDDYPTAYFDPATGQIVGALGLILVGFAATAAIARVGARSRSSG